MPGLARFPPRPRRCARRRLRLCAAQCCARRVVLRQGANSRRPGCRGPGLLVHPAALGCVVVPILVGRFFLVAVFSCEALAAVLLDSTTGNAGLCRGELIQDEVGANEAGATGHEYSHKVE